MNHLDYLGKYQMGNAALIEAGLYSGAVSPDVQRWDDSKWTAAARSLGVTSRAGFLASASAQEYAVRAYTDAQWKYLVEMGLDSYAGQVVDGERVTAAGMLAGAHLMGAHSVEAYLTYGNDITDPNGTPVSSYIGLFPGAPGYARSDRRREGGGEGVVGRPRSLIRRLTRQGLRRVVGVLSRLARSRG